MPVPSMNAQVLASTQAPIITSHTAARRTKETGWKGVVSQIHCSKVERRRFTQFKAEHSSWPARIRGLTLGHPKTHSLLDVD